MEGHVLGDPTFAHTPASKIFTEIRTDYRFFWPGWAHRVHPSYVQLSHYGSSLLHQHTQVNQERSTMHA